MLRSRRGSALRKLRKTSTGKWVRSFRRSQPWHRNVWKHSPKAMMLNNRVCFTVVSDWLSFLNIICNSVCLSPVCKVCHSWIYRVTFTAPSKPHFQSSELQGEDRPKRMALHFNHTVGHSHPFDDSSSFSPIIGPSILHFGDVNKTCAVLEGVFNTWVS